MAIETSKVKVKHKGGLLAEAETRGFKLTMDEPEEMGGTNTFMNPVEVLLSALGGCMTIVATMLAKKLRIELDDFYVEVEGDLDPDGFTGKDPDARVGLQDVRYTLHIKSNAPEKKIKKLHDLISNYCPIKDTLRGVPVTGDYIIEK